MFGIAKRVRYLSYPGVDETGHIDVVGESYYQENLEEASRWKLGSDEYLWAALRAEPKNPHDPRAIRVDWILPDGTGWRTLGYVPRDETERWHPVIASARRGIAWVWPAKLIGGSAGKSFGVYLLG